MCVDTKVKLWKMSFQLNLWFQVCVQGPALSRGSVDRRGCLFVECGEFDTYQNAVPCIICLPPPAINHRLYRSWQMASSDKITIDSGGAGYGRPAV